MATPDVVIDVGVGLVYPYRDPITHGLMGRGICGHEEHEDPFGFYISKFYPFRTSDNRLLLRGLTWYNEIIYAYPFRDENNRLMFRTLQPWEAGVCCTEESESNPDGCEVQAHWQCREEENFIDWKQGITSCTGDPCQIYEDDCNSTFDLRQHYRVALAFDSYAIWQSLGCEWELCEDETNYIPTEAGAFTLEEIIQMTSTSMYSAIQGGLVVRAEQNVGDPECYSNWYYSEDFDIDGCLEGRIGNPAYETVNLSAHLTACAWNAWRLTVDIAFIGTHGTKDPAPTSSLNYIDGGDYHAELMLTRSGAMEDTDDCTPVGTFTLYSSDLYCVTNHGNGEGYGLASASIAEA